jgi:hypothetical protein
MSTGHIVLLLLLWNRGFSPAKKVAEVLSNKLK